MECADRSSSAPRARPSIRDTQRARAYQRGGPCRRSQTHHLPRLLSDLRIASLRWIVPAHTPPVRRRRATSRSRVTGAELGCSDIRHPRAIVAGGALENVVNRGPGYGDADSARHGTRDTRFREPVAWDRMSQADPPGDDRLPADRLKRRSIELVHDAVPALWDGSTRPAV
jgi:hypothetical protein